MTYLFHTDTDPAVMDRFVMDSDQNTLFQCSPWAKIKNNWSHVFASVTEDDRTVATALVLFRKMPLGMCLAYVPRGPVMDYNNAELVKYFLENLKELAKKRHAIALRFDPSILSRKYPYRERNEDHPFENQNAIELLKSLGAKHKGFTTMIIESTQPRYNAEMDVTEDYRDHLEHKTAKCIRAAEHKGIEVLEGPQYIPEFAKAMHYTEVRKGVALRNEEYFRNMMDVYGNHAICMVTVLDIEKQLKKLDESIASLEEQLNAEGMKKKQKAALNQQLTNDRSERKKLLEDQQRESENRIITCGILAVYNDSLMELFYMGNHPDYLRMYSSYLLYAKCLDRCVELGITHCSFGGIEGTLDDGLTLFKSNWIMNVEEYIGEFNIVLNPLMYKAFDDLYPWLLKTAAKIRSKK